MRKIFLYIFVFFFFSYLVSNLFSLYAAVSLESYCKDGYYQIPGEKKCSRAPKCGGYGYDDVNKAELMPNNNDCLDEGRGMVIGDPPNTSAFYGYPPLCCYEMERLKDPEMCIGYWERLWCHPDQCKAIDNSTGCGGGGCNCAHAMKTWCEIRKCNLLPPVPIEVRLGQKPAVPTALPPTARPQPTTVIIPTSVPIVIPTIINFPKIPTNTPIPFSITEPTQGTPAIPVIPSSVPVLPVQSIFRFTTIQALFNQALPQIKIKETAVNTILASKKVFDVPIYAGTTILSLDQQLELFINNLIRQIAGKMGIRINL